MARSSHHLDRRGQRTRAQQQRQIARLAAGQARDLELRPEHAANRGHVDDLLGGDVAVHLLAIELDLAGGSSRCRPPPCGLPTFSRVVRSIDSAPRASSLIETAGPFLAGGGGRAGELIAGDDHFALEQDRRAVLALVELGAERRVSALLGLHRTVLRIHQPELQRRDLAEQILHLGRILHARQLHVDAVQALSLHDRLGHAQFVDAIRERGAVLLQRVVLARLDLRRGQHHVDCRAGRRRCAGECQIGLSTFRSAALTAAVSAPAGSVTRRPFGIAPAAGVERRDVGEGQLGLGQGAPEALLVALEQLADRAVDVDLVEQIQAAAQVQAQRHGLQSELAHPGRGPRGIGQRRAVDVGQRRIDRVSRLELRWRHR